MSSSDKPKGRVFTEAARMAALAARQAKREQPDRFGLPELFIVSAGAHAFTWELRRFGGVVLQRGSETFASLMLARTDGEAALAALGAEPDLPTFKRQTASRTAADYASPKIEHVIGGHASSCRSNER